MSGKEQRQFFKDEVEINFYREKEMDNLIDFGALAISNIFGIKFKELSLEQYLHFYETIIKNPKRVGKREKDLEKIRMIKEYLK